MKTKDIKLELVGKRVTCVAIGEKREGVITEIIEDHCPVTGVLTSKGVKIKLDKGVCWGDFTYTEVESTARIHDDWGNLMYTELI